MPALLAFFLRSINTMAWIRGCYLCAILVLVIQGCRSHETIVEGLGQNEANVVLVALREENINARKEGKENRKGTSYNILVEKNQAKDALRILVHQQLPKVNRPGFREVYPPGSSQLQAIGSRHLKKRSWQVLLNISF